MTRVAGRKIATEASRRLPEFVATRSDLSIPTRLGTARATVYRAPGSRASAPVHVNFHGGGYVLATTELDDPLCRAVAMASGSTVINVDYVVSPQHRFPHPPQQAFEIVKWIAAHGQKHGWDGSRLSIGGQSAGGGLAAAVARQALELKGPDIALQILHYPPLDLSVPAGSKPSASDKPTLRPWMGAVFDSAYVPDPAMRGHRFASSASVGDTADLTGLAPAMVIAAELDILRGEARRYADRLDAVGALIEYRQIQGADHGYDGNDDVRARETYLVMAERIRNATSE
ncbi:alpha/beta hydrolase fold domain-containing protein [Arthrobacter sp.]|uniref:alpha/beta hydrolase fold domain-containing protein n=1 Tax=Arthrobacter sp. TaxID=1667 RepID=UPI003A8EA911